ncbi:MAG: hypothetical protein A2X13_08655 [Bacteroidetes bacterium GWC2_33_15]|nr:MAG: hypothetical protein A2X10_14550 [Bacteroidetes bacterium GWA2_33_15]OFX51324.1 MAG: hypothetical protein A2X13_08655 [Bacteroidetes bacterium GWC2_33_15]OFX65103.1 MAG: hypothetical protein A2X15_06820 [Bacteroidetes bacterium GWB2_32_14]OFX70700.1 MAG: hypothetical protein A2X14_11030 [Bacteroidetes bacterium GWD2_33_33]HAN18505.1 hypothetical protein [Bacteroidales bacterium]
MILKRLILAGFFLIVSLSLFAQEQTQKLDTILLLSRKKLVVHIKNVSSATVRYFDPKTQESITIERKQIQQIVFSNGRKEVFNKPVFSMVDEGDWKTVIVTDRKSDVEGLYELGTATGMSPAGSRNAKAAKNNAVIRIQKRAAQMGGAIVLVTKEEPIGGFGESPSYYIEGIVYGFEPPKEEDKPKEEDNSKNDKKSKEKD